MQRVACMQYLQPPDGAAKHTEQTSQSQNMTMSVDISGSAV